MVEKAAELFNRVWEGKYPLILATVSGAHLYGFPSPDSDYDLRGVHVGPLREVVGLRPPNESIERSRTVDGIEVDLVSYEVKKLCELLLKKNGTVLEQIHSPLVVATSPEHEELKEIAKGCVTRYHCYHYLGFAQAQWTLFETEQPPRVKPLLYTVRVLLTGVHLMRTGEVEANLPRLNDEFRLSYVPDLIARKTAGTEQAVLSAAETEYYRVEYERLRALLESAAAESALPERPVAYDALNDWLVRIRLGS